MLRKFDFIIFDCDGVILNSNNIKSEAFYDTVKEFGEDVASRFYNYHIENGGISRYAKFEYFKNEIIKDQVEVDITVLLEEFSKKVLYGLVNCEVVDGLDVLRSASLGADWSVVSGSDELELKYLFRKKGIEHYFQNRIFGSPRSKYEIIEKEREKGVYQGNTLFIGDSKLDYEVAKHFNFDFIFVSQWTDLKDWRTFCFKNDILNVHAPSDILTL